MTAIGNHNVAFTGRIARTKENNIYEKSNTWKNLGMLTGAGIAGGSLLNADVHNKICDVLELCEKRFPKSKVFSTKGLNIARGLVVLAGVLAGCLVGMGPDALINKCRRKEADKAESAKQSQLVKSFEQAVLNKKE